jgi:nucleotide-binding universal stress UspA family protein
VATTFGQFGTVAYDHVLIPLDGSKFAAEALETAAALAERFGAALHAISVAGDEQDADRLRTTLPEIVRAGGDSASAQVVVGDDPVTEILRRAQQLDPCLVCLSTHGRGRIAGAVIGSAARELLQRSPASIVAVGPSARQPSFVYDWPAPLTVPRLVACVDGSAPSEAVLTVAAQWATTLDMELSILTVSEPLPPPLRPDTTQRRRHGPDGDADAYVAQLAAQLDSPDRNVTAHVAYDPLSPARGVQAHLGPHPAGLVAVTTHARTGMQRLWFGATAASIIQAATVPVLVVPIPT